MDFDDNNASSDFAPLVNLLRQIIEVLEASSIAEERGKGAASKFWAAYKKISGEYDDNMLERCNGNMDIIMLFAGLFSAVNTAFIIAMQPNPADTTNDLLVQFMQHTWNGSSVAQPVIYSAPVSYSSSKIWMQVLAYMSLTFSLLAAFGAVLGKQWLSHYKTNRFDRGRLGDRCQHRHRKFEELKKRWFEHVLHSFPVLLQISLVLFILSLAAAMWMQHRIVSYFIIVPTACGALLYLYIVGVSLRFPDSPFQTWISLAILYVLRIGHQNHDDSTASAMSWILDTSTNPDVLSLALDLMVTMSKQSQNILFKQSQHVLSSSLIKKVLDMFRACFKSTPLDQDNAVSFGRALIHISWKHHDKAKEILNGLTPGWEHWQLWRALYLPSALEQCHISFRRMKETTSADPRDQADNTRTALRMALGAGMNKFVNPDEEYVELVWHGEFGSELDPSKVDWLMECAEHYNNTQDFEAAGDALLLLSHLKSISQAYIIPFLNNSPRSRTLRHSALRAACRAVDSNSQCDSSFSEAVLTAINSPIQRGHNRGDLFAKAIRLLEVNDWSQYDPSESLRLVGSPLIDIQRLIFLVLSAPSLGNTVEFSQYCRVLIHFISRDGRFESQCVALRIAYRIRQDLAMITGTPNLIVPVPLQNEVLSTLSPALFTIAPSQFDNHNDFYYLRLIFALASHPNWLPRLDEDRHIERCITIIPVFRADPPPSFFYLAGIFVRIQVAYEKQALPRSLTIARQQWWNLMRMAWHVAGRQYNDGSDSDVLDDGIDILQDLVAITKSKMPPNTSNSDLEFLRNGLGGAISKLESRESPPSNLKEILSAMKDLKRLESS